MLDPGVWLEAGSEAPAAQAAAREKLGSAASRIIPGHGAPFEVTDVYRQSLRKQLIDISKNTSM